MVQRHGRVETRGAGTPIGAGGFPSADLIGQDKLEELGVTHLCGPGEGEHVRGKAELGIVAFDDAPWTRLVSPHLTVVRQPAEELGRAAAQLLLARLNGQDGASRTLTLNAKVVHAIDAYAPAAGLP